MTITRAALGRTKGLAALYDAREDAFLCDSLLTMKPNEDMIDSCDLGSYFVELVVSDKFTDKATSLGIESELQASIISGLIEVTDSGKYLLEKRNSSTHMSMNLIYKVETKNEEINLRQLKKYIDMDALKAEKGLTHVVVGIDWGARCTVSCEYSNIEGKSDKEIRDALQAQLFLMKEILSGAAKSTNNESEISKAFTFSVKSDLTSLNSTVPINFEQAVSLARSLPEKLKITSKGKGIPLVYHMKPLNQVTKMCKLDLIIPCKYEPIEEMIVKKCTQLMDEMIIQNENFRDIMNLPLLTEFVSETVMKEIEKVSQDFKLVTSEYRTKFQDVLRKVRSGEQNVHLMNELQTEFTTKLSQLQLRVKIVSNTTAGLLKVEKLSQRGFVMITKRKLTILESLDNGFVLYINTFDSCSNENNTFKIFNRLFQIHSKYCKFLIVKREIVPDKFSQNVTNDDDQIVFYKDSKPIYNDVAEMITLEKSFCSVELKTMPEESTSIKSSNIRLMVDNEFYNAAEHHPLWTCVHCQSNIQYGHDTKLLYCRCGQSGTESIKFCSQDVILYSTDKKKLKSMLEKLPVSNDINILILGETGVGKSTWINGIFNYFMYESLNDACENEISVPIPSQFQISGKTVFVGKQSRNENTSDKGESSTRGPRLYSMIYKNYKINVIDTPGVGDSRGINQDKVNFDNILAFLTHFDKLHGVCILMKPNNTRNSVWFRFCIEELLTHLHTSIVNNILFCFTNARSTFYQPGDTLPVLQEYLKSRSISLEADPDKNCFCFDNEAFRYLACLKNEVEGMNERFSSFSESWDVARRETLRMLKFVCRLTPHDIAQTISVNSAREAVLLMAKPSAEMVNKIIPENIQRARKAQENLNNSQQEIGKLESILKVEGKSFKVRELDYPRTVCTGEGCWTWEEGGIDSIETRKNYHQICHDKCTIEGLSTEAANDERLSKCWAFQVNQSALLMKLLKVNKRSDIPGFSSIKCNNPNCKSFEGEWHEHMTIDRKKVERRLTEDDWELYQQKFSDKCRKCGHSYKLHMHITYDLQTVSEIFIKPEVQKQILNKKTEEERYKALSDEFQTKVKELEDEREKIFNAQITFGLFIKYNALVPYNDAFEELVKMYIREEETLGVMKNKQKLEQLRQNLDVYREKKKLIDSALAHDHRNPKYQMFSSAPTPETVMALVDELKSLKHNGNALKDAFEGIVSIKKRQHEHRMKLFEDEEERCHLLVVEEKPQKSTWKRFTNWFKRNKKL